MRQLSIRHEAEATEFQCDDQGRLFDPRIRALLRKQGRPVTPGTEALAALRILGKKMHMAFERWTEQYGLSEGRFQILVRLNHVESGRLTMGDLAEVLDVSPRTVTGLIDNLERDGLVRRVDNPNDRRAVYAEITDAGKGILKKVWREAVAGQSALTRGISDEDLIQVRHLCLRLIQAMSAEEGKIHARN